MWFAIPLKSDLGGIETVLDPFGGSGTVALKSDLGGIETHLYSHLPAYHSG